MAFKFKLIARKNPQNRTAPAKFHAQVVLKGKLGLKDLAKRAAASGMSSEAVLYGSVQTIMFQAKQAVLDGFAVDIEDFLAIYPHVSSEGADSVETFNVLSQSVKKSAKIRAKKEFLKDFKDVPLEREE